MFTVTKKGLFALPVREGRNAGAFPGAHHAETTFCQRYPCGKEKLFAHTVGEDKLAALQMQTTLYGHVMHAKSVAVYRRVHTHTYTHMCVCGDCFSCALVRSLSYAFFCSFAISFMHSCTHLS